MKAAPGPRDPSRRRFLLGTAGAGGALMISTQLGGCAGLGSDPPESGEWEADACLRISSQGIKVRIPHAEMGQGIATGLTMLVAEELDVDLEQIEVELAPAERAFDHPEWGVQLTGGSSSMRSRFLPLRYAGAGARELLRRAGAERFGVDPSECRVERGYVCWDAGKRRASYLELAEEASRLPLPDPAELELRPAGEFRLLGKSVRRIDIPAKVDGSARFGIDSAPEDAAVACIARPPRFGAEVRSFDASRAERVPGVKRVVAISNGVAVVADSYWTALRARAELDIEWESGPNAGKGSAEIQARYADLIATPADEVRSEGDTYTALDQSSGVLEATYSLPYLAHAPMEPMNASAHVTPERCRVWAPTQSPGAARDVAVAITGLDYEQVSVYPTYMGGGFGRRSEIDFVIEAVEVSRAVEAPVQVIWSREDDLQHGFYRPATRHFLRAGLDESGVPRAWLHRIAGPSVMERVMPMLVSALLPNRVPRWIKRAASGASGFVARRSTESPIVEGAEEIPYQIDNVRIEYARDEESFVPVGFWRSVGHSHNAFVVESFVDELAHAAGRDPYMFRRQYLADAPRHLRVLDRVAELANWQSPAADGVHRGIAVHASFGSVVAMVAEVRVTEEPSIRVERVFVAVDCGLVINPDSVQAQVESALAFGLSSTINGGVVEVEDGAVTPSNFDAYPILRMADMPDVVTELIASDSPPSGVGEIATPPIAPAVANAVFVATGKRLRSLPLVLPS